MGCGASTPAVAETAGSSARDVKIHENPEESRQVKAEDVSASKSPKEGSEGSLEDPILNPPRPVEEVPHEEHHYDESPAIDYSEPPPASGHESSSKLEHPDSLLRDGDTTDDDEPEFLRMIESGENLFEDEELKEKSKKDKKKSKKKKHKKDKSKKSKENSEQKESPPESSSSSEEEVETTLQDKPIEIVSDDEDEDEEPEKTDLSRNKSEDSIGIAKKFAEAERPAIDLTQVTSTKSRTIIIDPMAAKGPISSPIRASPKAKLGTLVLKDKFDAPAPLENEPPKSPKKSKKEKEKEHKSPKKQKKEESEPPKSPEKSPKKQKKDKGKTKKKKDVFVGELDEDQKPMAFELHKLLDHDPFEEEIKLDTQGIHDIMEVSPEAFGVKYIFDVFSVPVYPLSMLCALGAPVETVQRCYDQNIEALLDKDEFVGGPLHYACSYRGTLEIVKFLVDLDENLLTQQNQYRRTPLHMACMFGASTDVVKYLIEKKPQMPQQTDKEGMTPLHLACENFLDDMGLIELLIEAFPLAVVARTISTGSTPLHLALSQQHPSSLAKVLVKAHDACLEVVDDEGNIPLHTAVISGCDHKTIKFLVKCFPASVVKKNKKGETAWDIGNENGLDDGDLQLIEPKV